MDPCCTREQGALCAFARPARPHQRHPVRRVRRRTFRLAMVRSAAARRRVNSSCSSWRARGRGDRVRVARRAAPLPGAGERRPERLCGAAAARQRQRTACTRKRTPEHPRAGGRTRSSASEWLAGSCAAARRSSSFSFCSALLMTVSVAILPSHCRSLRGPPTVCAPARRSQQHSRVSGSLQLLHILSPQHARLSAVNAAPFFGSHSTRARQGRRRAVAIQT